MSKYSIKISYGSFNIDIKGDKELIYRIFSDIKHNESFDKPILSCISSNKSTKEINNNVTKTTEPLPLNKSTSAEVTDINSLILEKRKFTQTNWMLLIVWFQSRKGNINFSRKDIFRFYKKICKYTKMKISDYTTTFISLMFNDYIFMVNKDCYILTEKGINKATELLYSNKETTNNLYYKNNII